PEEQVAAFLTTERMRSGRLHRLATNGRSYDVIRSPLSDGGYVVCALETTPLVAAVNEAETSLARVNGALASLRTGLAAFGPGGILLFANLRFGELFSLTPGQLTAGTRFSALLDLMALREEFSSFDAGSFIATQRLTDRSHPSTV